MIFKNWTFRKKNKALILLFFFLLVISWFLAFGKTYKIVKDYRALENGQSVGRALNSDNSSLQGKSQLQDSLLEFYSADSALWVSGLLSNVGLLLTGQSVGVSFENKPLILSSFTVDRDLVLSGSFLELQTALKSLEKEFYIKSIRAYVDKGQLKYSLRLAVLKS